jgi:hypothetical protein
MKKIICFLVAALTQLSFTSLASDKSYLQLIDKLDRPHVYDDEFVEWREDGSLFFPAYKGCVTVIGLNQHALPYNELMLKPCGENSPFLEATNFQTFIHNEKQQVQLKDTELCVTSGAVSRVTDTDIHKWRGLFMQYCDIADLSLSQWKLKQVNL